MPFKKGFIWGALYFSSWKIAEKPCIYKNAIIFIGFPGNISFFSFLTPQIYGLIESKSSADVIFFSIRFGSLKGWTLQSLQVSSRILKFKIWNSKSSVFKCSVLRYTQYDSDLHNWYFVLYLRNKYFLHDYFIERDSLWVVLKTANTSLHPPSCKCFKKAKIIFSWSTCERFESEGSKFNFKKHVTHLIE